MGKGSGVFFVVCYVCSGLLVFCYIIKAGIVPVIYYLCHLFTFSIFDNVANAIALGLQTFMGNACLLV